MDNIQNADTENFYRRNKKMILLSLALIAVVIVSVFFFVLISGKNAQRKTQEIGQIEKQKKENLEADNSKKLSASQGDARLFVFFQDKNKVIDKQLFTLPSDFYNENIAGIDGSVEYKDGSLYIIRRLPGSGTNELWKYGKRDPLGKASEGKKLYSGEISKFSVSAKGRYVAVTVSDKKKLVIIDQDGSIMKEYDTAGLGYLDERGEPFWFGLWDWTADEKEFWGTLGNKPISEAVYKISSDSWEIKKYDVPFDQEWDLNVENKKIVYSDCPVIRDTDSLDRFRSSGTNVNLMVYDITSGQTSNLESATSKCFSPKWLNSQVVEYNDPNGGGRLSKIISQ